MNKNKHFSLYEGDGGRRIAAAEDIKYGAGFTAEQLAAAEQLTGDLELGLEGDDDVAARAQEMKFDLVPSAETLTFSPEQLATADAVLKGEVTPKIIKEAPSRAELDRIMDERLEAQFLAAQIKGDAEELQKAQELLDLHRKRVAGQAKSDSVIPEAPLPIL